MNRVTGVAQRLREYNPDAKIIYVMRDPRDVIVSRHGKNKDMYYSNIRLWRELHEAARPLFDHERFFTVRYEDFVSRPDAVQREIANAFPWLETVHAFSDYHKFATVSAMSQKAMQRVRPIAPTSIGLWRQNLARIKGQQARHGSLTPLLVECGYEDSDAWERELDGVEADHSRSRYPEHVYWPRRVGNYLDALRKVYSYRRMRRRTTGR